LHSFSGAPGKDPSEGRKAKPLEEHSILSEEGGDVTRPADTWSGLLLHRCKSPSCGLQRPEAAALLLASHPGMGTKKAAEVIRFQLDSCLHHCSLPVAGKEKEDPSALLLWKRTAKIPQWAFKLLYGRMVWPWQQGKAHLPVKSRAE